MVIPARFGSQRLPAKPIIDLAGKPMIVRVFDAVRAGLSTEDIVVAVDDERIKRVLDDHRIEATMTSPTCASGTDRVAEIARLRSWHPDDVVINVQGDEPLLPPDLLAAFADFCLKRDNFSMATIAVPVQEQHEISDPNVVKLTVRSDGSAITFSRAPIPFDRDHDPSEWNPTNYRRHLGIYAYRNDVLQALTMTPQCALERIESLEQLRALWLNIPIHVMDWDVAPPGGVDTAEDVERVTAYLVSSP
ncbi:3-deoxy-manno-octulosonate cytidylyltransferase [Mycolicibacterium sp. 120266]|uniref:3-deoxy-manno-octulosonate cytidylyltransferase n=1 Tax=Mycolicibacterium sp. 120266 TaxID=3090601 RepID=UPI00299D214C|nr:3-deoxy-manno-octulosonate cytidylyltransferase [Mycolicibacterium sp. 120266]MDX1872139.1 3-deoxy-manno-octulosonate cytidylyltransferase [Mycolicibacterium sp. 120266]